MASAAVVLFQLLLWILFAGHVSHTADASRPTAQGPPWAPQPISTLFRTQSTFKDTQAAPPVQQPGGNTPAWIPGTGWVEILWVQPPAGTVKPFQPPPPPPPPPAAAAANPAASSGLLQENTERGEGSSDVPDYAEPESDEEDPEVPSLETAGLQQPAAFNTPPLGHPRAATAAASKPAAAQAAVSNKPNRTVAGAVLTVGQGGVSPKPQTSRPSKAAPETGSLGALPTGRAVPASPKPVQATAAAATGSVLPKLNATGKPTGDGASTAANPPPSPPAATTVQQPGASNPLTTTKPIAPTKRTAPAAPAATSNSSATQAPRRRKKLPAGTWQGNCSMVAGTSCSAAISGLQGPAPFTVKQPGAQRTLNIGCLLARQTEPQGSASSKEVPDLTFEAMKLALSDLAPRLQPPINVRLTCYTTQCGKMSAVFATRLLVEEGAEVVVGNTCSSDAVAGQHITESAQVPMISAASSSPQLTGLPLFSRTAFSGRFGGAVAAKLAIDMNLKKVGIITEDNAFGTGETFYFVAAYSALGGNEVAAYQFTPGKGDAQAAVQEMLKGKAAGMDGVIVATNSIAFFADFLRAADKAKLDLPIIAPGGAPQNTELHDLLQDHWDLLKRVVVVIEGQGSKEFQARLKAAVQNREGFDKGVTSHAYDAIAAVLMAYAAAPEPKSGVDVAAQVLKQRFQGVSGPVVFDETGDRIPHNESYVKGTFDTKTGHLQCGQALQMPKV